MANAAREKQDESLTIFSHFKLYVKDSTKKKTKTFHHCRTDAPRKLEIGRAERAVVVATIIIKKQKKTKNLSLNNTCWEGINGSYSIIYIDCLLCTSFDSVESDKT